MANKLIKRINHREIYAKFSDYAAMDEDGERLIDRKVKSVSLDPETGTMTVVNTDGSQEIPVVPVPDQEGKVLKSNADGSYAWGAAGAEPGNGKLYVKFGSAETVDTGFTANSENNVTFAIPVASAEQGASADGLMSAADKAKLDGIEQGAQANAIETVMAAGVALEVSGKSVDIPAAAAPAQGSSGVAGLMSASDKGKLDGITGYVASASVSGRTLTLTPKTGEAVTFEDTGDANVIETVNLGNSALTPENRAVTIPLFNSTTNGAVTAPASENRNAASFLNGMGDWSMLDEATEGDIDDMFVEGVMIGGREYPVVKIGTQTWLAENLDYKFEGLTVGQGILDSVPSADYYNQDEETYGVTGYRYGLLYNWYAANYLETHKATLIPGWHVPTREEWIVLETFIGENVMGDKVRSTTRWTNGNGTDDYKMTIYPAGTYDEDYGFVNTGLLTYFWTPVQKDIYTGDTVGFYSRSTMGAMNQKKCRGFSIRLVKDAN